MQLFLILLVPDMFLIHHAIVIVIAHADFQPFSISYISHLYSHIIFNIYHFKILLKYARCV